MSKKRILQAAEPAKPVTALAFLPAFPYCNSLPVFPLQIPMSPLHLQFPSLNTSCLPSFHHGPGLPPKVSVLRPAGLTQLQCGQEVRVWKLVRLERPKSKKRGLTSQQSPPPPPSFQLMEASSLYSSISSSPLPLSLLRLKLATDLREWGG